MTLYSILLDNVNLLAAGIDLVCIHYKCEDGNLCHYDTKWLIV